jgi:hypothetical protein
MTVYRARVILQALAAMTLIGLAGLPAPALIQEPPRPPRSLGAADVDDLAKRVDVSRIQGVGTLLPRQPTRVIGLGTSSFGAAAVASNPRSSIVYVTVHRDAINIWSLIAEAWPEIACGVPALVAAIWLVRLVRRRRFHGQPHCRLCNYCLTGVKASNCPECGVDLAVQTPVFGKRLRRRIVLVSGALVILVGAYATWIRTLPRQGDFSNWQNWWSAYLYEYAVAHNVVWLRDRKHAMSVLAAIDPVSGDQRTLISTGLNLGQEMLVNSDGSELVVLGSEIRRSRIPTTRLLVVRLPSGGLRRNLPIPDAGWTPDLVGYARSGHEVYVFAREAEDLVAIDVRNGTVRSVAPVRSPQQKIGSGGTYQIPTLAMHSGPTDLIAVAELGHPMRLIDPVTGASRPLAADSPSFAALSSSPDGGTLFTLMGDGELWGWHINDASAPAHRIKPPGLCWTHNMARTVSGRDVLLLAVKGIPLPSGDGIWIVDFESHNALALLEVPAGSYPLRCLFSGDGRFVHVLASAQGSRTWDLLIYDISDVAG